MITPYCGAVLAWLERLDPGTHRRIKGLRLVTAFGIAWMASTMPGIALPSPRGVYLGSIAAGFALWASVSEARTTRAESSRDLLFLVFAAMAGAATTIGLTVLLPNTFQAASELSLVVGAFCVGYLRRFGVLGTGIGSQIFIGQLLAYGYGLTAADLGMVVVAAAIAVMAVIVPRVLCGPTEHPTIAPQCTGDQAMRWRPNYAWACKPLRQRSPLSQPISGLALSIPPGRLRRQRTRSPAASKARANE
jgi:hypothetical protein